VLPKPTKLTLGEHLYHQSVLVALEETRIFPVVALAVATSMRRGELLALRWCDVDLPKRVLRVVHSLEQTKTRGLRLKSLKTKSGKRWIELPDRVLDILNAHNKAQLELRLQLVLGKSKEDAFVFCNHDGTPISPNYFSIMWSRELKRAGLPKRTFHSLRHSHASELIRAGFTHAFEGADPEAAKAIAKVLG
jgi:integrase